MKCPKCGNLNAECVIGNFWKCPSCDAPKKPSLAEMNSALGVDIDPSLWTREYVGTWVPSTETLKLSREFIKHLDVGSYITKGDLTYRVLHVDSHALEVVAELV